MFFSVYTIPTIIFICLYSKVILTIRKRTQSVNSQSQLFERATREISKSAIIITCIFIVTIGYPMVYYLLGNIGVTTWEASSVIQKIGVFLSACNSVANPFIYVIFMPVFRDSMTKAISTPCWKKDMVISESQRHISHEDESQH